VCVTSDPITIKLPKRQLDRQAADVLREAILSGRFAPGLRLVEAALAAQLGVSRGTVRGALSELTHEGLVLQVAYTKWMVPELTIEDAWELYTLRGALEGLAARLAASRRTPESLAALEATFQTLTDAVASESHAAVAAADLGLHKTIVALSGHRRLIAQYRLIEQQVRRYIDSSNALLTDLRQIVNEHKPIVDAIVAGKAREAERLARDHNAPEVEKLAEDMARSDASAVKAVSR
jgi:DNA-binding GntR family transcriptional regulator